MIKLALQSRREVFMSLTEENLLLPLFWAASFSCCTMAEGFSSPFLFPLVSFSPLQLLCIYVQPWPPQALNL